MSKKVDRYKYERALKIQKRAHATAKWIFFPIAIVGVVWVAFGIWMAGWGPVVIIGAGLVVLFTWLNWYDNNVWIPMARAKEYGIIDE